MGIVVLLFVFVIAYVAGVGFRKGSSEHRHKISPEQAVANAELTKQNGKKLLLAILALFGLILLLVTISSLI